MKKVLSLLLALCLVVGMVPLAASAEDGNFASQISNAIDGEPITLQEDTTISAFPNLTDGKSRVVDLGGHVLTLSQTSATTISTGSKVTIKNGSIVAKNISLGTTALFLIESKSSIILDDVDLDTTGAALFPRGDAANVTVQNGCNINAGTYAVGTNSASVDNYDVVITLSDSTFSTPYGYQDKDGDNCTVMINVPGNLKMTNCTVTGDRQAVLVRAGNATITDCDITLTGKFNDTDVTSWGSGNNLPMGALVVGSQTSNGTTSYAGDAICTVENTEITASVNKPAVYVSANKEEEAGNFTGQLTLTNSTVTGNVVMADGKEENNSTVTIQNGTKVFGTVTANTQYTTAEITNATIGAVAIDESVENDSNLFTIGENVTFTDPDNNTFEATVNGKAYATLEEAIENAESGATITLLKDIGTADNPETINIPVGKNIIIDGENGETDFTIHGSVACAASNGTAQTTKLTLKNLTLDGDQREKSYGVTSQNQGKDNNNVDLYLTMDDCTVQNYTAKGLYLTNAKQLTVTGCTFENNACGEMDDPNTRGDYTIDLNLVAVQGSIVEITDTTFEGNCGNKAVVKVTARGEDDGTGASDITGTQATVQSVTISGCSFNQTGNVPALNIGTDVKDEDAASETPNTTGNYTTTIQNNKTAVVVNRPYKKDSTPVTVPAGKTFVFDGNGSYEDKTPSTPVTPTTPTYTNTVSDTDNGKVTVSPAAPKENNTVTITTTPNEGYKVGSVAVTDANGKTVTVTNAGNGKYTFKQPGSKVTIKVTFVWDNPFTDVKSTAWYYDAVKYVYENNLMAGTGDATFDPEMNLTRAMTAQILYNLEGKPEVSADATFADMNVAPSWSVDAIAWAQDTGVVAGIGNNKFDPNANVTREQFAQMMYNYAKYKEYDLTKTGDLSKFPDADSISTWAETAMSWANGNGLINGHDDGTLDPQGNTIRGQAASILMNFDLNVAK